MAMPHDSLTNVTVAVVVCGTGSFKLGQRNSDSSIAAKVINDCGIKTLHQRLSVE